MNIKDKFKGIVYGFAIGDHLANGRQTENLNLALLTLDSLSQYHNNSEEFSKHLLEQMKTWSKKQDLFMPDESTLASIKNARVGRNISISPFDSSFPTLRSILIAPIYMSNISSIIDFTREACLITHSDNRTQCVSVSSNILLSYAITEEIPVGLWNHELSFFLGGVDDDLIRLLNTAFDAVSENTTIEEFKSKINSDSSTGTLATAIYCCNIIKDKTNIGDKAIQMAKEINPSPNATGLTGALIGAKYGISVFSKEYIEKVKDERIDSAVELMFRTAESVLQR